MASSRPQRGVSALNSYSPFLSDEKDSVRTSILTDGVRADGRRPEETRQAFLKTGMVSQAAGSAYAEFGETKVMVAVYGPRESKRMQAFSDIGRLTCDVRITPFASSARGKTSQSADERELSSLLHKSLEGAIILETFPKAFVDVHAVILQLGGSDGAVLITAASMALADAGIAMLDLVSATSASLWRGQMLVDPTLEESRAEEASILLASMPSRKEVTQISIAGKWSTSQSAEVLELCMDGNSKLDELLRQCLREQAMEE